MIDVFSKYLHLIPIRTKSEPAVASAFRSIFDDPERRRYPIWVRTDKGKEFLNKHFRTYYGTKAPSFRCAETPT